MTRRNRQQPTETIVNFILDKSGSMGTVQSATISGFNEYIQTLKNGTEHYRFSLTLFNDDVEEKYVDLPLLDVENLTTASYQPNGMTALYDAVCRTLDKVKLSITNQKSLVIIMTDGDENSSKEYTEVNMKKMIDELTATGKWTFVFLGANQDSYAKARQYGISAMNAANFNGQSAGSVNTAFHVAANNTQNFARSAGGDSSTSKFFTSDDQDKIENTK